MPPLCILDARPGEKINKLSILVIRHWAVAIHMSNSTRGPISSPRGAREKTRPARMGTSMYRALFRADSENSDLEISRRFRKSLAGRDSIFAIRKKIFRIYFALTI